MSKEKHKNFHFMILGLAIVVVALFSLSSLRKPMIAESDAYSRVSIAITHKQPGNFFSHQGGMWLPFHFSLMGMALSVFDYPHLTPRIISLVFSLLSVIALYFYTKIFTNNKSIALISALLFLFFPLRYFLSLQTLSEVVFIFFLISSLVLISGPKKITSKKIFISLVLLNVAHSIRYESWILLPLLWLFILSKKVRVGEKVGYILGSIAFPFYWLMIDYQQSGSFLNFFTEKHLFATQHPIDEFFNLRLSLYSWWKKMVLIFPWPLLIISGYGYKFLFKKRTLENFFYYGLPLFFFLALVAQVFFGTMEWFPIRYLLIPIVFLIPILATSLNKLFSFFIFKIRKQQGFFHKTLTVLMAMGLFFLFSIGYKKNYIKTKYYLTTASFLSYFSEIHTNIEDEYSYQDFLRLKKEVGLGGVKYVEFYYRDSNRSWNDQALIYFLNTEGVDLPKESFSKNHKSGRIIVWEREADFVENSWLDEFIITYENDSYYILELDR